VPAEATVVVPTRGAPCGVRFDGRLRWSWWGSEDDGDDLVAARGRRVLAWESEDDCLAHALRAGWEHDVDQVGDRSALVSDLGPAQDWLARRATWLDVGAGLELWNWAVDVSRSTGGAWNPRGRTVDACYRKLFAANVPYFFGLESYRPQWSAHQLAVLRRVLGEAVHVVRTGCGDPPRRSGRRQKNSSRSR
jgi:hypothetical protein